MNDMREINIDNNILYEEIQRINLYLNENGKASLDNEKYKRKKELT